MRRRALVFSSPVQPARFADARLGFGLYAAAAMAQALVPPVLLGDEPLAVVDAPPGLHTMLRFYREHGLMGVA